MDMSDRKKGSEKQTERQVMQSILKNVKTSNQVSDEIEEQQPLASVIVNARNVRFLDKILSKKCKKCNSIKPPHSHHCSICKRCIARMDHHCPWVNNCVGYYNQKHFILFLIYVFNGSAHALYLLIKNGIYCLDKNCALFNSYTTIGLSKVYFFINKAALGIFLALLFCLFVAIMFCD